MTNTVEPNQITSPGASSLRNSITVTDNRTGRCIEIPIEHDQFIDAQAFKALYTDGGDGGGGDGDSSSSSSSDDPHKPIVLYDPALSNTAVAKSSITYIDGEKGILEYRGYRIEDLAEHCSFLEVVYLLINNTLPTRSQLLDFENKVMTHTFLHENLVQLMSNFRYDAHPMGMMISTISALSTFYPEGNPALRGADALRDATLRNKQIFRILGKVPTIAACAYRHRIGRPYNTPRSDLGYTENFLYMLDRLSEVDYRPHPKLARALDILFILHADHELNCSTATMRHVGSSMVDPYTAIAAAAGALYGPLHGGANEAVLHMLEEIGSKENVPAFIERVKNKEVKLMGFGHRVYRNYDPRCTLVKKVAHEVFELCGEDAGVKRLWAVAEELEKQALTNEYFTKRKLYPNIDFYSGLIYRAMGFPTDIFPVLFAIPRTAGWLAHWMESMTDPQLRIFRPRQVYLGDKGKKYVPIDERDKAAQHKDNYNTKNIYHSDCGRRRFISLSYMSENGLSTSPNSNTDSSKTTIVRHARSVLPNTAELDDNDNNDGK